MKKIKRYTTYTDKAGKLWTFDLIEKILFDPYEESKKKTTTEDNLASMVAKSILKEVWSTDINGKYI